MKAPYVDDSAGDTLMYYSRTSNQCGMEFLNDFM